MAFDVVIGFHDSVVHLGEVYLLFLGGCSLQFFLGPPALGHQNIILSQLQEGNINIFVNILKYLQIFASQASKWQKEPIFQNYSYSMLGLQNTLYKLFLYELSYSYQVHITLIDMSLRQSRAAKKKLPWQSLNTSYQQSMSAIKLAQEAFTKEAVIPLETSTNEKDSRIMRKSVRITEMARNVSHLDDSSDCHPTNIVDFIMTDIQLQDEKFGLFESPSEHSEDEEAVVEVTQKDIGDIITSVEKDPVIGKITFILKLINTKNVNVEMRVARKRGVGNVIPQIHQCRTYGNFTLYEIETNSFMKKIAIELLLDGKSVAESREISFSPRQILLDLDVSYDVDNQKKFNINFLEGLLASCVLEGDLFAEEILQLNGKRELKTKILNERYTVDDEVKRLIKDNKNIASILKLLKLLLEEEKWNLGVPSDILANPAYTSLAQIFITEMLKYKPSINSDEREQISTAQSLKLVELYIHFICLTQLNTKGISISSFQKEAEDKLSEFIHFVFQISEMRIYHRFIQFCIMKKSTILPQSYDTIKNYISDYNLNSSEYILTNFENIFYNIFTRRASGNLVKLFIDVCLEKQFENKNIYQKEMSDILKLSSILFQQMDINSLNFAQFYNFFKAYWNFRQNPHLIAIVRLPSLRVKIQNYMINFQGRYQKTPESQRPAGINVVELYYISMKDEELVKDDETFRRLIQYLIEKTQQKSFDPVIKIYFQIFKRAKRGFSLQFIANLSSILSRKLQYSTPEKALMLLSKYFNEEYLESEQLTDICNENLLKGILAKLIGDRKGFLDEVNTRHHKWHSNFKYSSHFNEQILEKMTRTVQRYLTEKIVRDAYLEQIKRQIIRQVQDEQKRISLIAIIDYDMLELNVESVWGYFIEKRGYLKILIKILKREEQSSEVLRESLMEIHHKLETKDVDFYKIQRLKSMKPNEWHYFVQLTDQNGIPALVNRLFQQGNRYLNVLKRLENFTRDIGAQFTSPNYQELCMKLQGLNQRYVKVSIRESNIEQQVPLFKGFKYEILTCYKLKPFFGSQELNNKPIELIVKACGDLLLNLLRKIEELYISYEKGSINSDNFYYFQPRKDYMKQFRNIILMNKQQAPQHLEDIITIYSIIADAEENYRLLNSFIVLQRHKYDTESAEIIRFAKICSDLKNKSSIPVIDIQQLLNAVHNKLRQFKLSLRDNRHFFELIALLIQNSEKIPFFMTIEKDLKDIKDEINQSGGDVEYEQIEDCEVTIEFLKEVYQVPGTFSEFISAYFAFIERKRKINKQFALHQIVKTAFYIIPQLKQIKANMDDSNRSAVKFIDEVIKRVRFELKNDEKNKDKVITTTTIYPQGEARLIDERQIYINKQKAIMISSTSKQGQNSQRKRQIDNFLEIVKIFEQLKSQQIKLTEWGCSQFNKQSIIVEISNCQTKNAKQVIAKRQNQFNQWRKQIKKLYQINYKVAHLQGSKLKQFYDFICANFDSIPNHFSIIIDNLEAHKSIVRQLKESPSSLFRNRELAYLYNYFQLLKTNIKIRQPDAPDRDENFLHFIKLAKGQVDFIKGIQEIGSERISKLKFQQLLICTHETSKSEIKSFIERALRDSDSEYIVIGFQNLDRRKQQLIVDQIKSFKAQYGNDSLKLKLCLIGDSQLELLYKFAVQELNKSPQKAESIKVISSAYQEKLKQECSKIKIVYSSAAGLGKTGFIKNDSLNVYKCTEQYYLPLSGIMAVPVESIDDNNNSIITNQTQKFLWDRFEQAKHFFTIAQKQKKNACLVIQIYNIEPSVVDIINKFLQNVLFFKSHKYRNNYGKLPKDTPIYIELQNVSLPAYNKLSKKFENLPPQMRMLPFLRQINTVCGQKIIQHIEDFLPNHIKISNADKELNYILYHLKLLKTGQINTKSISAYEEYKFQPISQEEGLKLIKEFFFDRFSNTERPSGYLWTYFRSLLLEASKSFSNSFFLTLPEITSIDNDVKQFNRQQHKKMKLKETFRSQFYKVIHQNCLDFIQRSAKPGQQNGDQMFSQTLKNLPFLIIPNIDGASFSFIYNNSANVPQVIKAMIVLQTPTLLPRISTLSIEKLFEEENLAALQRLPNTQKWIQKSSQILANISGNNRYRVDCERGYIVNIDNFFKMCLIVQRIRLNIPIVIMGEAGIGKTAILRHVAMHLFNHQFVVCNINAGLPLESKKSVENKKANDSLATFVENIQQLYRKIETENASLPEGQKKNAKKLWVFFDQFNTLRELGFFKEIIVDGRYIGKQQPYIKNVVMMAACNPHKKLILNEDQKQDQFVKEQTQRLAFDVLPAPHSLIECMWNYGGLTSYEYEKYISKMLVDVRYQSDKITRIILKIHEIIAKNAYESAVSLRDIDRFRQLYRWFNEYLPRHLKIKVPEILGAYNNIQERAFILSCYFTYILRFSHAIRKIIEDQIEGICNFRKGFIINAKRTQQNDLCARLSFNWDTPIALNESLKENLYSCFVCINTRLPLLIIGAPGCSKSLSLRILAKNLKEKVNDDYLSKFKRIRQYAIQGSQNTTTQDIKVVFGKAYNDLLPKTGNDLLPKTGQVKQLRSRQQLKEISVVVFDQIGLAQKSKDNPLKVLHPYLEVSREEDLSQRVLSFIGISNSELDVSKMSRLLVLRRPPAQLDDLVLTAQGIASGYKYGKEQKIKYIIFLMTRVYAKFLVEWKNKGTNYPLFYGLRDFYGLIKIFMAKMAENQIGIQQDQEIIKCAGESILQNFHGWDGTYARFREQFNDLVKYSQQVTNPTMHETLQLILKTLDKESFRYPLVIVEDHESLSFVKWMIERRYQNKASYMEGSPFVQEKEYSLKLLGQICKNMDHECVLILSNLSEGVKTGLYDFFNKSFTVRASNNNKYLKIRTQEGSLNQIQYLYHQKFNCAYLLLEKDLIDVEPPFLSRFQKYRFSVSKYREEFQDKILKKVERFIGRVQEICKNNQMSHFKAKNMFININRPALESMCVVAKEIAGEQGAYSEALKRLVMNSGQYFFKVYKHFMEPNGDLPEIKDIMAEVIQSKNNGAGDRNLIIRFTNDKQYPKKFSDKQVASAQFVTFKKQADFDEEISSFFKSSKKTLYITLYVHKESIYLNYVASQIEKARRRALAQNERVEQKKIRLLYVFEKEKEYLIDKDLAITHFTNYQQQFDDGRLQEIKNISKNELFNNLITINSLFAYVHHAFDFKFEEIENSMKAQTTFARLTQSLYKKKDGLLCKQAEDITLFLEPNIEMSEEVIKQMLLDSEVTNKYKNYREALTKYFADRKLLGALAAFMRYLFEKESFMSFSDEQLFQYYRDVEECVFDREIQSMIIQEKSRPNSNYNQLIKEVIESKKQFIKSQYMKMKQTKRLPSVSRKFQVKISKPRLLPFSKAQCETILNYGQKEIGWFIKQIFVYDERQQKGKFQSAMRTYEDQFKKKTKFNINNQKNLYATHINEDKCLKAMLMLDLLSDFCEEKGLPLKYLGRYYRIISEFFSGEVKNKKNERSISFSKMVSILIGYEDIWVQIFKTCQTLADDGHQLRVQGQVRIATREGIKKYVDKIYIYLQNLLLGANILTNFKNPEKYTSIYINLLFHLQKLEQLTNTSIPNKLKSTRTTLIFIEIFDQTNKARYIQQFMRFSSKIQISSHYHETYNYFQGLKVEASKEQCDKITEFEANQLFYEWFKQEPKNPECLRLFLQNCENEVFIHNSVATINLFISISTHNNYSNIQETFKRLTQVKQQHINGLLVALGQKAKASNFKNNLAIFITNIFIQKLTILFKNEKLILDNDKKFENILNKVMNSQISGIGTLFAFAYFKIYLKEYITRLVNNEKSFGLSRVDELLMKDNRICMNLKFYCLKLLRTFKPIKQIKQEYIKVKKVHWIAALQEMFQQGSSRSISVPNQKNVNISPTMIANMDAIIASHGGELNMIDKLVDQANNPYNRYALFNFFTRYYFSMSYNEKQYKNALKDKLLASRAKYTQKLGKLEFQLILRYAESRFDENIKVENASEFNQDLFAYLNSFNWLLASRSAVSPFHSLFFNNGEFHADFKASFENLFFPSGPENNFIKMAQNVYALTRNNNVGVYICSAQCNYIYSLEDCGWPAQTYTCPVCNKQIGCKPGKGHTVNRQQEGARRIQTPIMVDKGGKFYVYNMTGLTSYWEMQRNYIQAEINRMKKDSVINFGQIKVKITGKSLQSNQRVSTLSHYYFMQNLNSIFYCLLSLGVFSQDQSSALFEGKNVAAAKEFFIKETKSDLNNVKNALNLNNKFYGWLFGMHKNMYRTLIDFKDEFQRYVSNIKESSDELAKKLEQQINQKKVASDYGDIYSDMAAALRKGLLTKELDTTLDMTAANRFTRDFLQSKVESLIKVYTTMEKFSFAEENASLQGKMQFPRDVYLTEDGIDEAKFSLSRILKIPDKEIKYNEIIINYELNIRENYPFLDYVLKNSDSISSMFDFYNVLSFSNQLAKEVEFNYERKDSKKSLSQFVSELWEKKEERVHEILRQPQVVVASWNRLANRMGVLQNDCTVVGRMSNEYSVNTPIQAFLLDNSTKQNVYGLTLSSLYHNFAKMHNELVVLLNARKNQIPQFKCLNLYNESKKVHPQKLQENDVFMITQKELEENLYKNSISSINYGKNFIFNNFGTYQQYFLMKLLGKCQLISQIKKFKSICYNGEAFAQTSDSSNTLTEIREYFYEQLTKQQVCQLQGIVRNRGNRQQTQQYIVKLRGDLERTMVAIRNLNGIIEQKCIADFIEKLEFDDITYELRSQTLGRHSIAKIVHIYELLQFELKPIIIEKLPDRYKETLDEQVEVQITQIIDELPLQDDYGVTLIEFGYALYRFIARILQGGVQQNDKILMHFLPNREDFWPKGFQEYKLERLKNHEKMSKLPFAYAGHLFEIVERIVRRKVSSSRI